MKDLRQTGHGEQTKCREYKAKKKIRSDVLGSKTSE